MMTILSNFMAGKNVNPDILDDSEKLKRAIIAGSLVAGLYLFDRITADEWYEKDKDGNFVAMRKDIFKEIFE